MDIAILILLIVALLLLGLVTFFIFQIWIQSKETKIQMNQHLQEIQKGFANSENIMRTFNLQLIENIGIENKNLVSSLDLLRMDVKNLQVEMKRSESEMMLSVESHFKNFEDNIADGLRAFHIKTNSSIEALSDVVKLFKDNLESRIKELDSNLSDKLVRDLTDLTNKYVKKLSDEQVKVLAHFELAGKEINIKQGDILKAITEPLKINLKRND